MKKKNLQEFEMIIQPFIQHQKVLELKDYAHHGITRYEHSYRVAYYTYFLSKKLHLDYVSATKGALLHDFYFDEVVEETSSKQLVHHPFIASINANQYFGINELEKDIIEKHMFPITKKMPKYKESWIVDVVDDISAIHERLFSIRKKVFYYAKCFAFFFFFFIN